MSHGFLVEHRLATARLDIEELDGIATPAKCVDHTQCTCWGTYPRSLYPNWTDKQVKKSGIEDVIENKKGVCKIRLMDVDTEGQFKLPRPRAEVVSNINDPETTWQDLLDSQVGVLYVLPFEIYQQSSRYLKIQIFASGLSSLKTYLDLSYRCSVLCTFLTMISLFIYNHVLGIISSHSTFPQP